MTAAEIVEALDGWVERIARLGAAVVPRLRPGLHPDRIVETAARHRFTLSEEIAAIWAWHDGARTDTDRGTAKQFPGLIPGGAFFDLDTTLHRGLTSWYATCGDDEELADPDSPLTEEDKSAIWHREWVIFDWWLGPLVLTTTEDGTTDTFRFNPQAGAAWARTPPCPSASPSGATTSISAPGGSNPTEPGAATTPSCPRSTPPRPRPSRSATPKSPEPRHTRKAPMLHGDTHGRRTLSAGDQPRLSGGTSVADATQVSPLA
ncbi:hypothetical protein [Cellulomonas hominis]